MVIIDTVRNFSHITEWSFLATSSLTLMSNLFSFFSFFWFPFCCTFVLGCTFAFGCTFTLTFVWCFSFPAFLCLFSFPTFCSNARLALRSTRGFCFGSAFGFAPRAALRGGLGKVGSGRGPGEVGLPVSTIGTYGTIARHGVSGESTSCPTSPISVAIAVIVAPLADSSTMFNSTIKFFLTPISDATTAPAAPLVDSSTCSSTLSNSGATVAAESEHPWSVNFCCPTPSIS